MNGSMHWPDNETSLGTEEHSRKKERCGGMRYLIQEVSEGALDG